MVTCFECEHTTTTFYTLTDLHGYDVQICPECRGFDEDRKDRMPEHPVHPSGEIRPLSASEKRVTREHGEHYSTVVDCLACAWEDAI